MTYTIPRKHKNEHNKQKIGEITESTMSKFWSIMDSSPCMKFNICLALQTDF